MKRLMLVSSILLMLLWAFSVQGQDNLLTNPGFEPPFTEIQGNPPREVAEGWQPWHIPASAGSPSFQNRQPEYAPTAPDAARIRSGTDAQQVFSFFATHVGGVYQTVTGITPGTRLRFSVYAYVWSTTFEEPDISEEDGDVSVEVGIDPTGGTDGASAAIIWSPLVEQYDAYNEYSVEADAAGTAVTVFVRTSVGVPVKHNNIYLDDAALALAGDATAEPTAEVTVEPTTEVTTEPLPATATPITPDAPTATPVTPSATPITPDAATATPITPDAPTVTPITPDAATATPITPDVPTATPVTPSATPITPDAPTTTPAAPTATPTPFVSNEFPFTLTHVVSTNENVAAIAERYGSSVDAIAAANGLDANYLIFVGQELIIPVATQPGSATTTFTPSPTFTPTTAQIIVTATPAQTIAPVGTPVVYIVRPGDTLGRIARQYNTSVPALAQLNGIVNPNIIQVGQRLTIPGTFRPTPVPTATPIPGGQPTATPAPAAREYLVRYGDSLYTISLRFGVPISRIAQANNIRNTWLIYAGQRLVIP